MQSLFLAPQDFGDFNLFQVAALNKDLNLHYKLYVQSLAFWQTFYKSKKSSLHLFLKQHSRVKTTLGLYLVADLMKYQNYVNQRFGIRAKYMFVAKWQLL